MLLAFSSKPLWLSVSAVMEKHLAQPLFLLRAGLESDVSQEKLHIILLAYRKPNGVARIAVTGVFKCGALDFRN